MKFKKPKQLKELNLDELREICQANLDNITEEDDDIEHYIYETAMETVFGKNVWDWINEKL